MKGYIITETFTIKSQTCECEFHKLYIGRLQLRTLTVQATNCNAYTYVSTGVISSAYGYVTSRYTMSIVIKITCKHNFISVFKSITTQFKEYFKHVGIMPSANTRRSITTITGCPGCPYYTVQVTIAYSHRWRCQQSVYFLTES